MSDSHGILYFGEMVIYLFSLVPVGAELRSSNKAKRKKKKPLS